MPVTKIKTKWVSGNLVFCDTNSLGGAVQVGEFSSATAGSGLKLSSSRTAAMRVYTDDGGVALTATVYRAIIGRHLHATALTTGDISVFGVQGHFKAVANCYGISMVGGVWAYNESSGSISVGCTIQGLYSGLVARVDAPSGVTIAASSYVSAIGIDADLGGTHTGKAAVLHIKNPVAGVWDYFAVFNTATGAIAAQSGGSLTVTYKIPVLVEGGTVIYIPVGTF
jgi:hypothetical protein